MGDIADAMLNGDLCELCGVYLGVGDGYPRCCDACEAKSDNELKEV